VVAARLVLTAAHCVSDLETGIVYKPFRFTVVTGVANLRQARRANVAEVSSVLVYPELNPGVMRGDVALLVLRNPVTAAALRLAGVGDAALYAPGTHAVVAGWGITSSDASNPSALLRQAPATVGDSGFCKRRSQRFYGFFSPAVQLCAAEPPEFEASGCHGDSGGPLIAADAAGAPVQIGITSLGRSDCNPAFPGVFTRADVVSAWVAAWIAAVEAGAPEPRISVPEVRLPSLPKWAATPLAKRALGAAFGPRYRLAGNERTRCGRRIAPEKVKCRSSWFNGGDFFWGTITVYLAVRGDLITWDTRYRMRWVDEHCWFGSGNRRNCKIHHRTR
jgi:secreted trypsin-like serine protease